jgi:hypothetical protein
MSQAVITFDTLSFAKRMQDLGFTREQSEGFARMQLEILESRLVSREYLDVRLKDLEARLDGRFKEIDDRFKALEISLDGRFKEMESSNGVRFREIDDRFKALEISLDGRFKEMESSNGVRFREIDDRFKALEKSSIDLERAMFARLSELEYRMTIRTGAMIAASIGIVAALIKLL